MNLKEFNSLTDLFFYQAEKQNPKSIFLEWLNPKNKKNLLGQKHLQIFINLLMF